MIDKLLARAGAILTVAIVGIAARDGLEAMIADGQTMPYRIAALQTGDLVFRQGRSLESRASSVTNAHTSFSHVGIVLREGENVWVVHAVPNDDSRHPSAIHQEPFGIFVGMSQASSWKVVRRPGLSDNDRQVVQHELLQWKAKQPEFDWAFDLASDDKVYCTELAIKVFAKTSAPIDAPSQKVYLPAIGSASIVTVGALFNAARGREVF